MSLYLHEAQGRGDRLQFAHFSSLFLRDAFEMHRKVLDSGPMVLISIEKTTKHSARGKKRHKFLHCGIKSFRQHSSNLHEVKTLGREKLRSIYFMNLFFCLRPEARSGKRLILYK